MVSSDVNYELIVSKLLSLISKFKIFLSKMLPNEDVERDIMTLEVIESEASSDISKIPYLHLIIIQMSEKYSKLLSVSR